LIDSQNSNIEFIDITVRITEISFIEGNFTATDSSFSELTGPIHLDSLILKIFNSSFLNNLEGGLEIIGS